MSVKEFVAIIVSICTEHCVNTVFHIPAKEILGFKM